jgi:hypothetical protein
MKLMMITLTGALLVCGCSASGPQPGELGYESYQQRLAQSREHTRRQQENASQAVADRDRRRSIEAQVSACQNENQRARHSAQLYGQREYQARDCNALRRQLMGQE